MCLVLKNYKSATVPLSITALLINFNGFPSTFREESFMNPSKVGTLVSELFSTFKKFKPPLKYTSSDKSVRQLLLTSKTYKCGKLSLYQT